MMCSPLTNATPHLHQWERHDLELAGALGDTSQPPGAVVGFGQWAWRQCFSDALAGPQREETTRSESNLTLSLIKAACFNKREVGKEKKIRE